MSIIRKLKYVGKEPVDTDTVGFYEPGDTKEIGSSAYAQHHARRLADNGSFEAVEEIGQTDEEQDQIDAQRAEKDKAKKAAADKAKADSDAKKADSKK